MTCEQGKDVRAKKVRVMLAAKDMLKNQVSEDIQPPKYERPNHWIRWRTMCEMKRVMEEEEEMAKTGTVFVRKVWEVSLSFLISKRRPWDEDGLVPCLLDKETDP